MIELSRRTNLEIATRPLPRPSNCQVCEFTKQLMDTFATMKPGESFMLDTGAERLHALRTALRYGVKITTRKINGKGYQIQLCERD